MFWCQTLEGEPKHFFMSLFSCKQELQLPWICFEILNGRGRGWEGMCHGAAHALRPHSLQELQPRRPKLSNVKSKLICWMDRRNLEKQQGRTGLMWPVSANQQWMLLRNQASVDLLLSGNTQSYSHISPVLGADPSPWITPTVCCYWSREQNHVKRNSTSEFPLPIYSSLQGNTTFFLERNHLKTIGWNKKSAWVLSKPSPDSSVDVGIDLD